MTATCGCGRPVKDDAYLCQGCTERLARDLGDIGALAEELQTTRLRQSRTGGQPTGVMSRSYDKPLVWNEHAADTADLLRSTVVAWVRVVLDERGGATPADDMTAMGRYLLAALEWVRHSREAAGMADEMRYAVSLAYRAIDTAPGRLYVGPCDPDGEFGDQPCTSDLYAREGAAEVSCPSCELVWNVASRRAFLLESAADRLVTASDLSRFLTMYGEPLTAERIRQWASRTRDDNPPDLIAHGRDQAGRPLYRVSEAVDLLARKNERRKAS